jgi:two-component system, OmpR family, KDP operon response regulator KdpE
VPIIVLSVREAEQDKSRRPRPGVDDYVTKPFGVDELLARPRAALSRAAPVEGEVRLTPTEWHIVEVLVRDSAAATAARNELAPSASNVSLCRR